MTIRAKLTSLRAIASTVGDRAKFAVNYSRAVLEYRVGIFLSALGKVDAAYISETLRRVMGKPFSDSSTITEQLAKDITKPQSDAFSASDLPSLGVSKPQSDSSSVSETSNRQIGKGLSDSVGVTDDIDGEASILDDQEIDFFKVRRDTASVSESFARTVTYNRAFTESNSIADLPTVNLHKFLSDSVVISDDTSFERVLDKDNTAGVTELTVFAFGKSLSDSGQISEQKAFSVGKVLSDSGIASESQVKSTGKVESDTATIGSSGSLISQGYCDFTYFAEDYVGTSRTFT